MDYKEPNSTKVQSTQKIKVFPNPAINVANILGLINSEKADIFISDVYGNKVSEHLWRIEKQCFEYPYIYIKSRNIYNNHSFPGAKCTDRIS